MVGVFSLTIMSAYQKPSLGQVSLLLLVIAVIVLALRGNPERKPISPVEATQANQVVVQPAEETSNQVETGVVIRTRIQFGVGVGTNGSNNQ